ncbi:MAG: TonB-dependent receptor plug domain-containing protein [Armatimonadota bacterium]
MLTRVLLVVFSLVFVPPPARLSAQEPPPEFELPDVISPGRRPQRASATPASVSVLTAADLRRLGVRTVGEAIAFLPETLARAYGGPGSLITPSIRGSSAEQVLVLLDGVPLNGVFAGTVDLSTIPIDDVERIEVLRGPFSAIYGSGAMGGVISIVTRRRARPTVALGGGSPGVVGVAISGGGLLLPGGRDWPSGGSARFSLRYDGAQGERPNSDLRSGYLSIRLGQAGSGRSWDLSLFATAAARGVPGSTFFPAALARQDDRRIVAAFSTERSRGPAADRLRLSLHRDGLDFRDPVFGTNDRHTGTSWSGEWQRTIRVSPARVVAIGVDGSLQQLSSTSVGERSATIGAAYLQDDRVVRPRLVLSTGLRADWHSAYGVQVNPRVGLVYFLRPETRLRLAAGRTFRGPTFADLYFPFDGFVMGNPALRPEQAWSIDMGLESSVRPGLVARATAFWSDVRDLIIYVPDAMFVFSPQNIGSASIRGASIELEGAIASRWHLRASSTWLVATDAATGLDLPNRPRHAGALTLSTNLRGGGSVAASAVLVGARFANTANTGTLPGYLTVGLAAQAPIAPGVVVRASISNLLDARYEPVQGYPSPGRTVFAEVVLQR